MVLTMLLLCACGLKESKTKSKAGRPTTYDGKNEYAALLDYANRLEKSGNAEAVALVHSKIPQAAAGEANEKIEEFTQENETLKTAENITDAVEIAGALKGGK